MILRTFTAFRVRTVASVIYVLSGALLPACSARSADVSMGPASSEAGIAEGIPGQLQAVEQLIREVYLTIESRDVAAAVAQVDSTIPRLGGRIESSVQRDRDTRMSLRVPADQTDEAIRLLATLGVVKHRRVEARDVGGEMVDLEARLANWIALRDRLREHLARAETVSDVLAVERELARIQADIDALQGRLDHLRDQVAFSRITLEIQRKVVLGPLGWLAVGLGRVIGALFIVE